MTGFFRKILNRSPNSPRSARVELGMALTGGGRSNERYTLPHAKRAEHVAILGRTGSGKSFFLRHLAQQDIRDRRGFVFFDFHGDAVSFLASAMAREENEKGEDLSERLILIEPADPEYSAGLNVLQRADDQQAFVQIAEFAQILKQRWRLESLGPRTEELLRNSLYLLADNELTLLELSQLLTDAAFRASCLRRSSNAEIGAYFEGRYDRTSDAMQAVLRDAILNKISAFTSDARFRHILGQASSTFSLAESIDAGRWIVLNLSKGRLGEQAATFGSLFLTLLKNALFARRNRDLVLCYADELQNLALDEGIETLLSEARKFGVGFVCANQFLEQYPPLIRAAVLSVGTHIAFQLSAADAQKMSAAFDGGHNLAALLRNLPHRRMVVKSGGRPWKEVQTPSVERPAADPADLYRRCRNRWARPRRAIEQEIRRRHASFAQASNEALNDWE